MNDHEIDDRPSEPASVSGSPITPSLTRTPRRQLKRNSAACERCRKRKQKCDGKLPSCGPCLLVHARCVPSERLLIRVDPNCQCESLKERVRDLESQVEALRTERRRSVTSLDPSLSFFREPEYTTTERVAYHGRILLPTFAEANGGSELRPALRGSLWQLWAVDTDSQTHPIPATSSTSLPSAPYAEALVEVFFKNRWPQLPFFHKPTFIQNDFLPLKLGESVHPLSSYRVNMVLAIASAETNAKDSLQQQHTHRAFFQAAIKDLNTVLSSDDLDCIQCLLLLCLYGTNEPQSVNIWYTLGLALRIGLGMDLHREETSSTGQSLLSREMARRIFWCTYALDRSISIAMGRPLGINDSDITVPLPQRLTDEQLCSTEAVPNLNPTPKDMSTFLHVIKLRQINSSIYTSLHAASSSASNDCDSLDALREAHYDDLNTWLVTAPRYGPASGVAMLQTAEWFQIAYHYAVLSLHRPSSVFPVSNISSLRLCADSAISLITCYNTLYAKNRITYTFVALNSLFMAGITMLYALRSSPVIRNELSKGIAKANIDMCQRLLQGVSDGRSVGERCAVVVGRLGQAIMDVFDRGQSLDDDIDTEFMSWFGLKLKRIQNAEMGQQVTPSVDIPWNDLFIDGFDWFDAGNYNHLDLTA